MYPVIIYRPTNKFSISPLNVYPFEAWTQEMKRLTKWAKLANIKRAEINVRIEYTFLREQRSVVYGIFSSVYFLSDPPIRGTESRSDKGVPLVMRRTVKVTEDPVVLFEIAPTAAGPSFGNHSRAMRASIDRFFIVLISRPRLIEFRERFAALLCKFDFRFYPRAEQETMEMLSRSQSGEFWTKLCDAGVGGLVIGKILDIFTG